MLPIGVAGHILVDALNPNLQTCAAVAQHRTTHTRDEYSEVVAVTTLTIVAAIGLIHEIIVAVTTAVSAIAILSHVGTILQSCLKIISFIFTASTGLHNITYMQHLSPAT